MSQTHKWTSEVTFQHSLAQMPQHLNLVCSFSECLHFSFLTPRARSCFTHETSISILRETRVTELNLKLTKAKHWACIRINSPKEIRFFINLYTQSSSLNHHVYFSQHYEALSLLLKDPFHQRPQILLGMFPGWLLRLLSTNKLSSSGCTAYGSPQVKLKHWSIMIDLQGICSLSLS